MAKRQTSIRLSALTDYQLKEIVRLTGSTQSTIIAMAIDDFYNSVKQLLEIEKKRERIECHRDVTVTKEVDDEQANGKTSDCIDQGVL